MALRFIDGFKHYATADGLQKWNLYNKVGNTTTGGPTGGGYLSATSGSWPYVAKTLDQQATWILGGRFYFPSGNTNWYSCFALWDTVGGSQQWTIQQKNGDLRILKYGGGILTTLSGVAPTDQWLYIEVKSTINNSTGTMYVRVNGVSVCSLTGQNTRSTSNNWADQVCIGSRGNGNGMGDADSGWRVTDLYACDTSGTVNIDFLGDVRVDTIYPSGAGTTTGWTPSTGSNYACVDDAQPSTSDFVSTATTNAIDTYAFGDLATTSGEVKGVQFNHWAKKSDAGTRSIAPVSYISPTPYVGTTTPLSLSYTDKVNVQQVSPATSIYWTIGEINGAEFGQKVVA